MTAISLFSGMGGDSLGLVNSGFKLVAFSEINKIFRETHHLNFPNTQLFGENVNSDILKIPDEEFLKYHNKIDLVFAGFPCQGFSNAGKKKINDPRNTLFKEFHRATKLIKPKIIIGENVKGLLSRKTENNENYIDIIKKEFEKLGYDIQYKVFDCEKYNIPQLRRRLIILGIQKNLNIKYSFPKENNIKLNLKNIIEFDMKGCIKINKNTFDFTTINQNNIIKNLDNDENENNIHPYLKSKVYSNNKSYNNKTYNSLISFSKRDSPIHCEIINIDKPSKTIICTYEHQPRLFVPIQNKNGYFIRPLLVDELKQIQGFPKNYIMNGNIKQQIIQIGNAVPPPLIELICKDLIKLI